MKYLLKRLLVPVVLLVGLAYFGAGRAEAARWRVHVHYPGYHATYVYRYGYPYYYSSYYWAPPAPVYVYRPAPVVVYPSYFYAPAPPCAVPYYHVW